MNKSADQIKIDNSTLLLEYAFSIMLVPHNGRRVPIDHGCTEDQVISSLVRSLIAMTSDSALIDLIDSYISAEKKGHNKSNDSMLSAFMAIVGPEALKRPAVKKILKKLNREDKGEYERRIDD